MTCLNGVRKKSPRKKASREVRGRIRVRLGIGLGLGSGGFFPGGFFLRAVKKNNLNL